MPDKPSWDERLKGIISEPGEQDRIATVIGIRPITLTRWISGESKPRLRNIKRLLQALPQPQREQFAELLPEEFADVFDSALDDRLDEIEYKFIMQVLEIRASTPGNLL